jgi:hypothetical protein
VASFGDGIGFLLTTITQYDVGTNATNHFLYVLLSRFLYLLTGANALTLLVNASIVYSLITLIIFYKIVALHASTFIAIVSTLVLGLSFTYWRQSEIIEVYSFNNMFYTATLYFIFLYQYHKKKYLLYAGAVMLGLATLAHIQNILLLPFWLAFIAFAETSKKEKGYALLIYVSMVSILLLLPLITNSNSLSSVFFDRAKDTVMDLNLMIMIKGFLKSCLYFGYNFLFNIVFILMGVFLLWRNSRIKFLWLALGVVPFWFFAMRYNVTDNYMFFTPAYILLLISVGMGWGYYSGTLRRYNRIAFLLCTIANPFIYKEVTSIAKGSAYTATFEKEKAYKGGLEFYLYPGRRNSVDALQIIDDIHNDKLSIDYIGYDRWCYEAGVEYNKKIKKNNQ